ncbi:glycosyltransferase family 2 protein [Pediococcus pentosaceus]|uniref:glycosyltransferase family 2 protein n=1 Tax=Pediococcus pentosaceus TaxID=1255 RepID=UPI000CFE5C5D|nr:glycosyltransferase family 2 protein [Pediococcus pentosaceus]AVL02772.1 glycosyltransferase [Pediococcus pentosaceus]MBF7134796.1 glycosyltransferase family 2 protein [Pediococcus pentosaceus]QPT36895.1 glycosyltransferase family 2 protein [Pediococcus pentosaceus]
MVKVEKTDVVVVTYNRLSLLKECLESLLSQGDNIGNIFVIDNNSSDGTSNYLNDLKNEKIKSETLTTNIGGAAGFEYGINKATVEGKGQYIWIMDDDTIPQKNALSNLIKSAHELDNKFGFIGSNVRWIDGTPINVATPTNDWPERTDLNLIKVKTATFVSILVKKDTVKLLGLPLGEMQIWGDDTEYTSRLSHNNPCYLSLNSQVIHKTSKSVTSEDLKNTDPDRLWRYKCSFRNGIYTNRKYNSKKKTLKNAIINATKGFKAIKAKNKKMTRLGIALEGTLEGFFFNPKIKFPKDKY